MIMPSYTTFPESQQPFHIGTFAGLRGLGCGCSDVDPETGDCYDPDPCTTTTNSGSTPVLTASDCAYGGTYPNCNPAPSSSTSTASSGCPSGEAVDPATGVCTQAGNTVAAFCSQQGESYNSATGLCVSPTGTSTGLTTAQINAIIAGATKVGTVAAAGATGATVLANGTVVGTGGSSAATASTIASSLKSVLPIVLIGLVAIFALKGSGK